MVGLGKIMGCIDSPELQRYLLSWINSVGPLSGLILTQETHRTSTYPFILHLLAHFSREALCTSTYPSILHVLAHFSLDHLLKSEVCDKVEFDAGGEQTEENANGRLVPVQKEPGFPQDCFVGRGYDKKEKEPKWGVAIFKVGDSKPLECFESLFKVQVDAEIFANSEASLQNKDNSMGNMSSVDGGGGSGIGTGVSILANININAKFQGQSSYSGQQTNCSGSQNIYSFVLRMTAPWNKEKFTDEFKEALENLPRKFNTKSREGFLNFIQKWGTHLVVSQKLGGTVKMNSNTQDTTKARGISTGLNAKTTGSIEMVGNARASVNVANASNKFVVESSQTTNVKGGDPTLTNCGEWKQTVIQNPSALNEDPDLKPFSDFLKGDQQTALRQATEDYLQNTNKKRKMF